MSRYLLTVTGPTLTANHRDELRDYATEMFRAGILLDDGVFSAPTEGFQIARDGASSPLSGGAAHSTGYFLVDVRDASTAKEWARRAPLLAEERIEARMLSTAEHTR